jgi:DNA helicase II / ATP-dependent DNA helicase PcrA
MILNLDVLNPEQRAAVLAPDGPILILAGAGSGKTRAITYRIAHLLGERNVEPREVLAVTFTNKAAAEMRERVAALIDGAQPPWVSTFHSACARILRAEARAVGYEQNYSILDEGDSMSVIRDVIEAAALADSPAPELARARIEQAKNEAISADELAARAETSRDKTIAHLYRLYRERLRTINAMDFSDLQLLTYELFRDHPEILEKYQRRAVHLMGDEYQDTNRVQYLLVKALSERSGNICVVGDEDQSIYKWRGADIRNILDFEHDFPNAQIFKLEQNYRSTKTILAAAGAVISHNRERKEKTLWTENDSGEKVTYFTAMTERDEADFIAREIASLVEANKFKPADVVVFYRVNAQSRIIEEALVRRRLPYFVVGGHRFYELKEIRDLLAYLKVIANPADAVSLERMLGVPTRGIGARTIEVMKELAAHEGIPMLETLGRLETARDVALRIAKSASALYSWMHDLIQRAPEMSVRGILDEIIVRSGFISYLEGLADGQQRRQNVAELLAGAGEFDNQKNGGITEYLENVALISDADAVASAGGRVALMTLHTSKGLEYPVVFIAGMEEGLFPHQRSNENNGENIEEERRLCYVGMTRARQLLYLTNTLSRELYGQRNEPRPSRFLAEIKQDLLRRIAPEEPPRVPFIRTPGPNERYVDYSESQLPEDELATGGLSVGAQVMHPTFGRGTIRKREGRGDTAKVWINFDRGGVKLLVLKFANLRPI